MKNGLVLFTCCILMTACVEDFIGDAGTPCSTEMQATGQLSDLIELYEGKMTYIEQELTFVAYVVSSDAEGNHYGSLYVQDSPDNGAVGLEIMLDLQDSYLQYPMGTELLVRAKGLYLDERSSGYSLGTRRTLFGENAIARIPGKRVQDFITPSCGDPLEVIPRKVSILELRDTWLNTYLTLEQVEFRDHSEGMLLGSSTEDVYHELKDCASQDVLTWISQYADFTSGEMPMGSGNISGVLRKKGSEYVIHPSFRADIDMPDARCASPGDGAEEENEADETTEGEDEHLLISEIADPENAPEARFIELFNSGEQPISLDGWKLERYTNANTETGSVIDLSGILLEASTALVIAAEEEGFEAIYGLTPDLIGGKNSAAGSNGDDNFILRGPDDRIMDAFGRIGEDGSGTDHEFEDGRALRKTGISRSNPEYLPEEWIIHNDTGAAGTINEVKHAPADYSPGVHQ